MSWSVRKTSLSTGPRLVSEHIQSRSMVLVSGLGDQALNQRLSPAQGWSNTAFPDEGRASTKVSSGARITG